MPIVDRRTNSVVLRIVYDGPPEAGKTTNLRHLCERLSLSRRGPLESPGGGDRTQFFDWLDVTGGWVGGHRVRCQLVTVPGQIQLARRRRHILDSADVVVVVADSRPRAAPETNAALRSLVRGLGDRADVPLVLQANKQDLPEAQPPEALRALLGLAARVPVVAAHAASGAGVVETFMLAVRLAVDHVRALLVAGELGEGNASTAADLLRALEADAPEAFDALDAIARAADAPAAPSVPAPGIDHAAAAPTALAVSRDDIARPAASPAPDLAGVPAIAARNTPTRPIRRSRMNLTEAAAAAVEAVNQALRTGAAEASAAVLAVPGGPASAAVHASLDLPWPSTSGDAATSTGTTTSGAAAVPPAEHAAAPPIRIVRCAPVRAAMMSRLESPISTRTTTLRGTGRGGPDSGASAADAGRRVTSEEPTRPIRIIRGAPVRVTRTGAAVDAALRSPLDPAPVPAPVVALRSAPDSDAETSAGAPNAAPAASPTLRGPVVALHGAPGPGADAPHAASPHAVLDAPPGAPNPDAAGAAPAHVPAPVLAIRPAPGAVDPSGDAAPRARPTDPGPFMALGTAPFAISPAPRAPAPGDPEPTATGTDSFPAAAAPGSVSEPAPSPFTVAASVLSRSPGALEATSALGAALFSISGPRASALPPPPAAAALAPVRAASPDDDAPTQERAPLAAPASAGGLVAIGEPIVEIIAELIGPEPVEPPRRRSPAIAIVAAALASPSRVETVTAEVSVPEGVSGDAVTIEIVAVEAITVERPALELESTARVRRTRPLPEPEVARFAPGPLVPFAGTDEDTTWEMPAVDPPPPAPRREPAPGPDPTAEAAAAMEPAAIAPAGATKLASVPAPIADAAPPIAPGEPASAARDAIPASEAADIASMLAATGGAGLAETPAASADAAPPIAPGEPASSARDATPAPGASISSALGEPASATEAPPAIDGPAVAAAADSAALLASPPAADLAPTLASPPAADLASTSIAHGEPASAGEATAAPAATAGADSASTIASAPSTDLAPAPATIADASISGARTATDRATALEAAIQAAALVGVTPADVEAAAEAKAAAAKAEADLIASLPYPLPPMDLPAGLVWPAVSGRAALAALETPLRLVDRLSPWAPAGAIELECGDGWVAHSSGELLFGDLEQARPALFEVARWQAKLGPLSPPGRTYALSPEPNGVRMWVLTPSHRTAWVAIEEALAHGDRLTAARLARTSLEAVDEIRARGAAITDLDHIAADEPVRLLATPWTPDRDRLIAQLQRLFAAAVL